MRGRKQLARCPRGHPRRAYACASLAWWLDERFSQTGSQELLEEIITLNREALSLQPPGHRDRAISCNNLALALQHSYEVTGATALLDEAITLHREALSLRSAKHPDRAMPCNNLANALRYRYEVTGVTPLLDEAITLHREALCLRPAGHPLRTISCNNLAIALQDRYKDTGVSALFDEAITLHREALSLTPAGHPDRAISCNNLAAALQDRYKVTGISALLDEAITLLREDLSLTPAGHPDRAISCNDLAAQLLLYFQKTRDITAIDEALILARESAASASPWFLWSSLFTLCSIYMEQGSPHLSVSTATEYLSQASSVHPNNITYFMKEIQRCLALIWSMQSTWTPDISLLLLYAYSNLIDGLSRMTGFLLDVTAQLTALKSARSFGSDACIAALLSNNPRQAMELVDHAHGVIWAQALHQRDPQLQDVPGGIALELESLLRAVSIPVVEDALKSPESATPHLSRDDVRHQQNSRIQTLLTEVRAMPGLERFMLGGTYTQLRETASVHPVVVLVSAQGHTYALIIRNAVQEHPDMLPLKITSDRLARLRHTATRVGLRTRTAMRDIEFESDRQMRPGRFEDTALGTLASLWHEIVKPVAEHLQLPVRIWPTHLTLDANIRASASNRPRQATTALVRHGRLCLSSHPRSRNLHRARGQPCLLLRLRGVFLHLNAVCIAQCTEQDATDCSFPSQHTRGG
jgi:tetratricopeptide (TPR) repeat protein